MNIKLKNGMEVIPYETQFALRNGVVYHTAKVEMHVGEELKAYVTLYPSGVCINEDGYIAELYVYDSNGNVDVNATIEHLYSMDIEPFTLTLKKFRKWADFSRNNPKLFVVTAFDADCDDCETVSCSGCKSSGQVSGNKPDVIRVVRYLRNQTFTPMGNGYDVETDNLTGLTIVADLDYKNQHIVVYWSDCRGDNFDKTIGQQMAVANESLLFPMLDGKIPECGLVQYLYEVAKHLVTVSGFQDKKLNKFYRHLSRY